MGYAEDLLGPSDARALLDRHDGDHTVSDSDAEDYITTVDFWAEGVSKELGEILSHLMVVIEPVGIKDTPTTADILSAYNSLRALKRKAMDVAKEQL